MKLVFDYRNYCYVVEDTSNEGFDESQDKEVSLFLEGVNRNRD